MLAAVSTRDQLFPVYLKLIVGKCLLSDIESGQISMALYHASFLILSAFAAFVISFAIDLHHIIKVQSLCIICLG